MFVVEYPCDRFCHIEVELIGERGTTTLEEMWEKADGMHRREHEPELAESEAQAAQTPAVEQEAMRRPAATVFRSAPGRGVERRR
jgi:hypothetical protein